MSAVIFGAGTYGEVYLRYLSESGVQVQGFLDDDPSKLGARVGGVEILGGASLLEVLKNRGISAVYCPIGHNRTRVTLNERARKAGLVTPNFVHGSAIVGSPLPLDSGIYLLPGCIVMPCTTIERDVMISMAVNVAHHTVLRQGVFLSTGVSVGASIDMGQNAYVGMKATLVTGKCKTVGANSVIGAGAVVVKDVAADETVAGVPARTLGAKPKLISSASRNAVALA